jgi:hypothetical protein
MRLITRVVLLASIAIAAGCCVVPVGSPRAAYYGPGVYVQPYGYGYHSYYGDRGWHDHGGYYGH